MAARHGACRHPSRRRSAPPPAITAKPLRRDEAGVTFTTSQDEVRDEFPIQLSNSGETCGRIPAARSARVLRQSRPCSMSRGRRESRVRAAPAVSCANMHKKRTRAYRFSGGNPAFPARWFTAYSALSLVTGLSCHHRPQEVFASRELDASVGASGPHGFAVRLARARLSRARRPPHPIATFVTIATRPSFG